MNSMLVDVSFHRAVDAELALLAKLPTMYPILRSSLGMHVPDPAFDDIDPWRYQALFHSYEVAESTSFVPRDLSRSTSATSHLS